MAGFDYRNCSGCGGGKAIYDADWYERMHGRKMAVLCNECSNSNDYKIVVLSNCSDPMNIVEKDIEADDLFFELTGSDQREDVKWRHDNDWPLIGGEEAERVLKMVLEDEKASKGKENEY